MGASVSSSDGRGGRGRRRSRRGAPMAEINITPFVDVMLVLLIVFMVAAPLLTAGVPLRLPQTEATQLPRERSAPLAVSVDAEGRVYIEKEELSLERLPDRLREELARRDDDKVYVRGDRDVGYGVVMRVMGVLNANGFRNIGLVTDREQAGRSSGEAGSGGAAAADDDESQGASETGEQ